MKPKTQTQQTKPCEEPLFFEDKRTKNVVLIDGDKDKTVENNQEIESIVFKPTEKSPDLSSQLNPSGCGRKGYFEMDGNKIKSGTTCGQINPFTDLIELCPICFAKRLATAKALYNEKKKTLNELNKGLEMLPWCDGYTQVVNDGKLVDLNSKIEKMNKWYSEKVISLMKEIKQIENEVPEVEDE